METSTDYSMTDHEITPSDKQLTKHKNMIKKPIQTNNNNELMMMTMIMIIIIKENSDYPKGSPTTRKATLDS